MPHFARFEKRKKNETMENLTENTIQIRTGSNAKTRTKNQYRQNAQSGTLSASASASVYTKLAPLLTKRRSQLQRKLHTALNENEEDGILDTVKFVYSGVHGSLKLVLQDPYKNWSVFFYFELEFYQFVAKVNPNIAFPYKDESEK